MIGNLEQELPIQVLALLFFEDFGVDVVAVTKLVNVLVSSCSEDLS